MTTLDWPAVLRQSKLAAHSRTIFAVVISVVSLGGCVYWATKQEAPDFPSSAGGVLLILAAVLVYAGATMIRGWRWHMILRHAKIDHRLQDAMAITTIGYMGNTVLPARGGEVLRILLMGDHSSAMRREILGSIVPERILDAAALVVLFLSLSQLLSSEAPTGIAPGAVVGGLLVLGLIGLYVYHRLRWHGHFERFAARIRPVARASRLFLHPWGAGLFALTIGIWLLEGVTFDLCAQALNADLSFAECTLTVVIASFFSLIPAGPGFVGTYDAAVLFSLKAFEVAGGRAIGLLVMVRFVVFVPVTLIGLLLVMTRYGGLRILIKREREAEQHGQGPGLVPGAEPERAPAAAER
jgi:glycosyltransferase 2 family protein